MDPNSTLGSMPYVLVLEGKYRQPADSITQFRTVLSVDDLANSNDILQQARAWGIKYNADIFTVRPVRVESLSPDSAARDH